MYISKKERKLLCDEIKSSDKYFYKMIFEIKFCEEYEIFEICDSMFSVYKKMRLNETIFNDFSVAAKRLDILNDSEHYFPRFEFLIFSNKNPEEIWQKEILFKSRWFYFLSMALQKKCDVDVKIELQEKENCERLLNEYFDFFHNEYVLNKIKESHKLIYFGKDFKKALRPTQVGSVQEE